MRDVERQQCLVLLDEVDAAAKVDMHVPQARDEESALGVQRSGGLPGPLDLGIGSNSEDLSAEVTTAWSAISLACSTSTMVA